MLWQTHAQTVRCVHSCPALYDNKVSREAHESAFEHNPHRVRVDPPLITWPALAFARFCYRVRGANSDLCQALRGTIGYNN